MAMLESYCLFVSGIKLIIFICTLFHRLSLGNQYIFTSQYLQNIASKKTMEAVQSLKFYRQSQYTASFTNAVYDFSDVGGIPLIE